MLYLNQRLNYCEYIIYYEPNIFLFSLFCLFSKQRTNNLVFNIFIFIFIILPLLKLPHTDENLKMLKDVDYIKYRYNSFYFDTCIRFQIRQITNMLHLDPPDELRKMADFDKSDAARVEALAKFLQGPEENPAPDLSGSDRTHAFQSAVLETCLDFIIALPRKIFLCWL